ncbi:ribosomal protein L6, alpha-beta domain-containing protein [Terfezia claveryi]|nr:ribosomal protein L6, alpha-beta domain-containing protein [Terfezia claveryi]
MTFTTSLPALSQVGRAPIPVPPEVKLVEQPAPLIRARTQPLRTLAISGPRGTFTLPLPHYLSLSITETAPIKATIAVENEDDKEQRAMWGTIRALLASKILGVSEGHTAILRLVGVGYRATMEQNGRVVNLKVGYAHPVELAVPEGVEASTPAPTRILLEGKDKQVVKNFAAKIRKWRVPEPYKGKGIFINNETIKIKAKKIK